MSWVRRLRARRITYKVNRELHSGGDDAGHDVLAVLHHGQAGELQAHQQPRVRVRGVRPPGGCGQGSQGLQRAADAEQDAEGVARAAQPGEQAAQQARGGLEPVRVQPAQRAHAAGAARAVRAVRQDRQLADSGRHRLRAVRAAVRGRARHPARQRLHAARLPPSAHR